MSSMQGTRGLRGATGNVQGNRLAGYDVQQMPNFTPEQMQLFQQSISNVGPNSRLSRLAAGDEGAFNEMEAPALRDFNGVQGNIASRFSAGGGGRGSLSSRRSSGFQNEVTQAGSNFAQDLQSRRQQLMRQAMQDLHGMSNDLLQQRPYDNFLSDEEEEVPFWRKALRGALPVAGTAFGMTPWGAATGGPAVWGSVGSAAGKAF